VGEFGGPLKVKRNGVFLFVVSHLVPGVFGIFVLCELGAGGVMGCASNGAGRLEFGRHVVR